MKTAYLKFPIVLFGCLCLSGAVPAQQATQRITELQLPGFLYPLGDIIFSNDTCIAMTANGGLYDLHASAWRVTPDSANLLLSYLTMPDRQDVLFTVYHKSSGKTCLYWRYQNDQETRIERLATLPGGFYRLLQKDHALFLFGNDQAAFHIYEYANDTLTTLYTSKQYMPSEVRALNRNTLLLAIGNRIVSLHRTDGLKELFHLDSPILSFSIMKEQQLFVVTPKGLCIYDSGDLKVLAADVSGKLFIVKETLYLLDPESRKIYGYRF